MKSIDFIKKKKKFGQHVRRLRGRIRSTEYKDRKISQQELADRSDDTISKKEIGEIERGVTNPKFETLLVLASVLKVQIQELLDFDFELDKEDSK